MIFNETGLNHVHGIFVDSANGLMSVRSPKVASTWLENEVFAGNNFKEIYIDKSESTFNEVNNAGYESYKCILLIREPISRYVSAVSELIYRRLYRSNKVETDFSLLQAQVENMITRSNLVQQPVFLSGENQDVHLQSQVSLLGGINDLHPDITWFDVDNNLSKNVKSWFLKNNIKQDFDISKHNASNSNSVKSFIQGYIWSMIKHNKIFAYNIINSYREDIKFYNKHKEACYNKC